MMALTYEEMRKQHFEELLKKAQRKLKYWEARLRKTRPNDMLHENVFKATNAGMECSFYKDALEALTANKWISIEERLPELNEKTLVCVERPMFSIKTYFTVDTAFYIGNGVWQYRFEIRSHVTYRPKYWMPLPEPPKEE